jgi:lysophospholipid acyltransferase (LPLAT)-like uncharacterized protein
VGVLKRITRGKAARESAGYLAARYLGLVRRTNRFVLDPPDAYDRIGPMMPVIAAMWHGQHLMVHFAKRREDRAASLVSRSADGEINAVALRHLGVRAIRGSGARGRDPRLKGGATALREMLRALDGGEMVVLTADVPKIARVCGEGIVTLARLSGRPIVPVAVAASRRVDFRSWDRASLGLPFGRAAAVLGRPDLRDPRPRCGGARSGEAGGRGRARPGPRARLCPRRLAGSRRGDGPCARLQSGPAPVTGGLPPLLRLYRGGLYVLEPAAAGLLAWRRRAGKEDGARLPERRGIAGRARPDGPLAWVHGASIGETLAALPVAERLTQAGLSVLVTSGTRAAAEVVTRRLPPGAFHQYVPLDLPRAVGRFLDHWRPDLALLVESEIWPNIILGLERRGIRWCS